MNVSFGSKVMSRTFGCFTMGSAVLFILRSRLLLSLFQSGVLQTRIAYCNIHEFIH